MRKKSYSELLKDPRWQKKRLEVLNSDDFQCQWCGDKETTLHVHHFVYKGKPWEVELGDLATICEECHFIQHQLGDLSCGEQLILQNIHGYFGAFLDYNKLTKNQLISLLTANDKDRISKRTRIYKLLKNG